MNRKWRIALAFLASTLLSLIVGILGNLVADTIAVENARFVWILLGLTFVVSLPIDLHLFLRGLSSNETLSSGESSVESADRLPPAPYQRFFGRDTLREDIISALREPGGRTIIGIDGMGGIGKTSLAHDVAAHCLNEHLFDSVLWEPRPEEIGLRTLRPITREGILDSIARHLGEPHLTSTSGYNRVTQVADLLREHRVLVVLDNLETVTQNQHELVQHLVSLFSVSKCIMTSRRRFQDRVYAVHLEGLEEESAIQLLRYAARERRIQRLAQAPLNDLLQVAQATGGSPLALKLVTGQLQHLPLQAVLERLATVSGDMNRHSSDESDYLHFYRGIFWDSWRLLSEPAQRLLVSMRLFAQASGGSISAVQEVSGLGKQTTVDALDELWRFSLVETASVGPQLDAIRYYLHPLTHYFVQSDLVSRVS